jgi:alpha-1,3-rhamnosyl/mannosyltransferase
VAARRADLVVTGSRVAADEIMNHSRIPEDRLRVIPLGVTPPTVGPDEAVGLRAQLGLSGRPYVLWVGSLEPRKGVTTLVKAMVTLGRQGGDVPLLVLAGYPGWRQNGLISPADRAELGARLVEVGIVDDPSLQALYQGAKIFDFPSLHEGFGLPVLEAMANGAPVVCSDLPVLREVSGAQAVLVETGNVEAWADVLLSLLADDGRRAVLAAAGRVQASRFPWEATVAATHEAYADVAPGRPAPGGN